MANIFGDFNRPNINENKRSPKSPNHKCYSKLKSESLKEIFPNEDILPVCPLVKEVINKEAFPNIPNLSKTDDKLSSTLRILGVFRELIARKQPSKKFIKWCAHRKNILQDCMSLIEKDLMLLPKRYEGVYPKTSDKLEKLIKKLYAHTSMYNENHKIRSFMLPSMPDESLRDFRNVLAWQKTKGNPDGLLCVFLATGYASSSYLVQLGCHYPAAAIDIMNQISNELFSLVKIDLEKAKDEDAKLYYKALLESKPQGNSGKVKIDTTIEQIATQLKNLAQISECPKSYQDFEQWKIKLFDIINTSDFLTLLDRLQYGQPKLDDGQLRKEAKNLFDSVNSITQKEADNYKVLGKVDDVRGLINNLAEMLERKRQILTGIEKQEVKAKPPTTTSGDKTETLKEPLEVRVAKVIRGHRGLTSVDVAKLAEVEGKNPSGTVRGTNAWKNRKELWGIGEPHKGYSIVEDVSGEFSDTGRRSNVVPVITEPKAEHRDINEMIIEFQYKKGEKYPTPEDISEKLSTPDDPISIERAKELLKETEHIFGYDD